MLNIDKAEMDEAWENRNTSDKFYKYLYLIAKYQVNQKGIKYSEKEDYIQFALYKCFKHQDAFNPLKNKATYSFFWKQIALAIAYKNRKNARRKNKAYTFYVEQEKILDWIEQHQVEDGNSFKESIDIKELTYLKKLIKRYNSSHKESRLQPSKENIIKVLFWAQEKEPEVLENFTDLKPLFKSWLKSV